MIAASLLVAAVVAAYASLAVLSLSVSTQGIVLGAANGVESVVGSVGWHPTTGDLVKVLDHPASPSVNSGGFSLTPIDFQTAHGTGTRNISIRNTSKTPVPLELTVRGAPGVSAQFQFTQTSTMTVAPGAQATIELASNPLVAGPINGELLISVQGSQIGPTVVPIIGDQAPEAPTAVTATPAARGAVNLSWSPSPSSGVAGYVVEASTGGAPFTQVGNLTTATTAVEQTGTNATTFSYEVLAVAQDVSPPLFSPASPTASATTDSAAPAAPGSVSIGVPAINVANVDNPVPVTVNLGPASAPTDTITVSLSSNAGGSPVSVTVPGGSNSITVNLSAATLPDGQVTASATAADALGNASGATNSASIQKITTLPDAPTSVLPSEETITTGNMSDFSVAVTTDATDAADSVVVTLDNTSGPQSAQSASVPAPAGGVPVPIPVDASTLPDGTYDVTATVTDAAGNTASATVRSAVTIDTAGPVKPVTFVVAAGPDNPVGVINAASQTAVTIDAHFADATDPSDQITISIDHGTPIPVESGVGTQDITLGPLDLSGIPDGPVALKMTLTDTNGNVTHAYRNNATKETSGPTAPSSVGVPAGADNPAGYVNAATQTAATIVATFDASTDPADSISISVGGDSNFPTLSGGSSQAIWSSLDLSQLPDGTLPILVTITDAAGNSSTFSGSLVKDTHAPPAPAAADVVGPPLDTITPGSASCVNVLVAFNAAPDPADAVTVTLSDGQTSVQGSAPAGNGQVTVGCIDASSLAAGNISVSVTITDAAGNSTTAAGTTATKAACHHHGGGSGGSDG